MLKLFSFIFELIRIILLLAFTMLIFGGIERYIYQFIFGEPIYHWLMLIGNFILFFVLYRNYLQFKGWYKSSKSEKLDRFTTRSLIIIAIALILIPSVM